MRNFPSNSFGLPATTFEQILRALESIPNLHWVKIYGSRAMGTCKPNSDIDLAFLMQDDTDPSAHLLGLLDELPTPYKFDVTNYSTVSNQDLKNHIDRMGVCILDLLKEITIT